ncbi:MAG: tetratricopeptide repeat protein [Sphingomonadaceae bacterium]
MRAADQIMTIFYRPTTLHKIRPLLFASLLGVSAAGLAQVPSKPLLTPQAIPLDDMVMAQRAYAANDPAEALARYLHVLDQNPRDLEALKGAGRAALDTGDPNAAVSFYARAEELSPQDGDIKAGLGVAMVQLVQPRAALRLFEDAVELGVPVAEIASDRGLAYALRGDSKRARADFELALLTDADPETSRRLALTQAIDGDTVGAMATLNPLLRRQDKAAWRARVFALAIGGDVATAQKTANAMLVPQQAEALRPFLARISKLRPSQQAAAVHFGQFPSDGRKYDEGELFAAAGSVSPPQPAAPQRTEGSGKGGVTAPVGAGAADRHEHDESEKREALTAQKPSIQAIALPPSNVAQRPTGMTPVSNISSVTVAIPKSEGSQPSASTPGDKAKPIEPVKEVKQVQTKVEKPAPVKKPEPTVSTSKAKHPERHWVQIATGAYKPDLGKEWSKLKKRYPALLGKQSPWTTPLNRTNRLLIGPFKTADQAQSFVNKAAGSDFLTSRFTSPAGQAITPVK